MGLSLSLNDKQALLRIYMKRGNEFEKAREMVTKFNRGQIELWGKLKQKKKSEVEIKQKQQERFEEEFMKLCQD